MKNPYDDLLGKRVTVIGLNGIKRECFVAFIEPDLGITMKEIDDPEKEHCLTNSDELGNPLDMRKASVTNSRRIWLDKHIVNFAEQVRASGIYDARKTPGKKYSCSIRRICPSTIH